MLQNLRKIYLMRSQVNLEIWLILSSALCKLQFFKSTNGLEMLILTKTG